jgi:hypothetical protein
MPVASRWHAQITSSATAPERRLRAWLCVATTETSARAERQIWRVPCGSKWSKPPALWGPGALWGFGEAPAEAGGLFFPGVGQTGLVTPPKVTYTVVAPVLKAPG